MEKLWRWIEKSGLRHGDFAKLAGITPTTLSFLLNGRRTRIHLSTARKIEAATRGAISARDIMRDVAATE